MKGSRMMLFEYATMMGVPLLLWLLAVSSGFGGTASLRQALALLIGLGSLVYGAVGLRAVYFHGGRRHG